jgi:hypothetical protein
MAKYTCKWVLVSGVRKGQLCGKNNFDEYNFCKVHKDNGILKEAQQRASKLLEEEKEFVKTHGMTSLEYKQEQERKFVEEHGMSSAEYAEKERKETEMKRNEEYLHKYGVSYDEYTEMSRDERVKHFDKMRLLKMKEKLLVDPEYHYKWICEELAEHVETLFVDEDAGWSTDTWCYANVDKDRVITLLDGRKFKIGLVPFKPSTDKNDVLKDHTQS